MSFHCVLYVENADSNTFPSDCYNNHSLTFSALETIGLWTGFYQLCYESLDAELDKTAIIEIHMYVYIVSNP